MTKWVWLYSHSKMASRRSDVYWWVLHIRCWPELSEKQRCNISRLALVKSYWSWAHSYISVFMSLETKGLKMLRIISFWSKVKAWQLVSWGKTQKPPYTWKENDGGRDWVLQELFSPVKLTSHYTPTWTEPQYALNTHRAPGATDLKDIQPIQKFLLLKENSDADQQLQKNSKTASQSSNSAWNLQPSLI